MADIRKQPKAQGAKIIWLERPEYSRLAALAFNLEKKHLIDHSRLVYSQVIKKLLNKAKIPQDPKDIEKLVNSL